ncbi:MAG: helix-turn-helix domain-containing protein [Candidatus Hydrogenedentes bacterium]|nr:helix-turn-helix domain-containing protein [Candidatus Hydrogenedentota bacterium]
MTTKFTEGSGNIFADLNVPNPELAQLKAEVAREIRRAIERKEITQKEAGKIMGVDKQKVSDITCGRLKSYTLDRLFRFLNALDVDVIVKMRDKPKKRERAELRAV